MKQSGIHSLSMLERVFACVELSPTCWLWTGARYPNGYGCVYVKAGKNALAHRVSWESAFGKVPNGKLVCHVCDVRNCVRPSHLFLGTHEENTRDMILKGRLVIGNRHSGESNSASKLTALEVRAIRVLYENRDYSLREIARKFSISKTTASYIIKYKTWKHIP